MATYYVDPTAVGADNGTTQANAWTTLQRAIDGAGVGATQPAAGDIVYCRAGGGNDETLAAATDFDGNSGSASTGYVKYIGVNSSWVADGTRYVLNGNSAATDCVTLTSNYIWFQNIEVKNATGDGFDLQVGGGDSAVFVNCYSHTNGSDGWRAGTSVVKLIFINSIAYNNSNDGIETGASNALVLGFVSYQNGARGIFAYGGGACYAYNKIFDNGNSSNNIDIAGRDDALIINNVIDGTNQTGETGINCSNTTDRTRIFFNRITNCATGIDAGGVSQLFGWNLFHNNTADTANAAFLEAIPYEATTDTNQYDPDADDGYNATGTFDYNLKASRTYNGDGNDTIGLNVGS